MAFIPNLLTIFRIFLVPCFLVVFFSEIESGLMLSLAIYILAGVTDLLDGYLARKHNAITAIGTVLDPLADKLMLIAVLGALSYSHLIPEAFFWIVLIKEMLMMISGCILYFSKEKIVIPANKFGKFATGAFTVSVILSFLFPGASFANGFLLVAIGSTIVAFFSYAKGIKVMH